MLGVSIALCVLLGAGPGLAAQPGAADEQPDDQAVAAEIGRLTAEFKKLGDWESQFRIIDRAINNMWSSNNWDSEPDIYARDTIREVARIPPWEFDQRIDRLTQRLAERYELPPARRAQLKAMIYRESFGFLWSNSGVLFDQIRQTVGARVEHRPFTPEQVAEWMRQGEPLTEDLDRRMSRMVREVEGMIEA